MIAMHATITFKSRIPMFCLIIFYRKYEIVIIDERRGALLAWLHREINIEGTRMRRTATLFATAALSVSGLLAVTPGIANASTVSAPSCESSSSKVFCFGGGGGASLTWTVTSFDAGFSDTASFAGGPSIRLNCSQGEGLQVSFSYVSGGAAFTSGVTSIGCNTHAPE